MKALINDIETLKECGVNVLFINENSNIADIVGAQQRFLLPLLGAELLDTVLDELEIEDSDYVELIDLCKHAAAPLAYWLDLPTIQTKIGDKGIGTFGGENLQAAHRWEFEELREALADKGCVALELLLQHLFDNKDYYDWKLPDDYRTTFITGNDFKKYFSVHQPYRTFESFRPLIIQVEDQYVRTTIGDNFFEELRDLVLPFTRTEMTDTQKKQDDAQKLLKKCVANLTIKTAVELLPVRISTHGFTVLLRDSNDKTTQGQQIAADKQLEILYKSVERTGESYLLQLKEYLNKNASEDLFATFKNSDKYTAPQDDIIPVNPNNNSKIFGF